MLVTYFLSYVYQKVSLAPWTRFSGPFSTAIPAMPELLAIQSVVFHTTCPFSVASNRKLDIPSGCIEDLR